MNKEREKGQEPETESLPDLIRAIQPLVLNRIANLQKCDNKTLRSKFIFNDHEALEGLSSLHKKYVIVPAGKALNNFVFVFVCKAHYFNWLIKLLGIYSNIKDNATYKSTTPNKDKILNNYKSFMYSLNIDTKYEDLRYLYCVPKLHKNH